MNSNTISFKNVNMKNSNAQTFMIFYIDNMISFANIFILTILFEFKNFLEIEKLIRKRKRERKKRIRKKKESFECQTRARKV